MRTQSIVFFSCEFLHLQKIATHRIHAGTGTSIALSFFSMFFSKLEMETSGFVCTNVFDTVCICVVYGVCAFRTYKTDVECSKPCVRMYLYMSVCVCVCVHARAWHGVFVCARASVRACVRLSVCLCVLTSVPALHVLATFIYTRSCIETCTCMRVLHIFSSISLSLSLSLCVCVCLYACARMYYHLLLQNDMSWTAPATTYLCTLCNMCTSACDHQYRQTKLLTRHVCVSMHRTPSNEHQHHQRSYAHKKTTNVKDGFDAHTHCTCIHSCTGTHCTCIHSCTGARQCRQE
jgi:hypothetical protein